MLIDQNSILSRFAEHLSWATEVDIATAWATNNHALRSLQQSSDAAIRVRAVVGLWGNLTDPRTLRTLSRIGELRLVEASRQFHPKVFLFRRPGRLVAWIGSANFTSGGFGMNEEALFETTNAQSVARWFDELWRLCGPIGDHEIDKYAASRRRNPPQPSTPPLVPANGRSDVEPVDMLHRVEGWRDYVDALRECDRWWSTRFEWSVLGELNSWSQTIEVLHDLVVHRDWHTLDRHDRRRMLGLTSDGGWALLGRMRAPAMQTVFGEHLSLMQGIVQGIAVEPEAAFPNAAIRAYAQLKGLEGVGEAIATRLLTLARPNRFVSLNRASKAGLAKSFAMAKSTLDEPRNYGRLLERVYSKAWYKNPFPVDADEETIRWMRAALLDCFMYKP